MKSFDNVIYFNNQRLDFHVPTNKGFTTIVFFHGGGIVEGDKDDPWIIELILSLLNKGYGVVNVNYSLYPNAKYPEYLLEAAQAVKFAFDKVKESGGNGEIIVSGQSAGAYLTMMLCSNHELLESIGINPLNIKGWFSDSAQMTDHFHYLEYEEHLNPYTQRISKHAPLFYLNESFKSSPIFLTCYTNDLHGRIPQNQLYFETVKLLSKNTKISLQIYEGNHCALTQKKNSNGEMLFVDEIDKFIKSIK